MRLRSFLILLLFPLLAAAQDRTLILNAFESASQEFNVPLDVLKGVAFAESRWTQVEYADNDTVNCEGMPHQYGVMALRDDAFFGRSLVKGAALIGQEPNVLKHDAVQNIRAGAAYLRSVYDATPVPSNTTRGSFESWQSAIERYCGIPQPELAAQHAFEIYARLAKGYDDFGIRLSPRLFNLALIRSNAKATYAAAALRKATAQPDYPPAHWVSANAGLPNWYTTGSGHYFVIIHDMEGYYLSVIAMFANDTQGNSSIHYDVNGLQDGGGDAPAGDITQQVEEQYWAWHAVCWNRYSFGIEHEGFEASPAYFSTEMYIASAGLTRHLCDAFSIPKDRNHIVGHGEWQNASWVNWVQNNAVPSQMSSSFATCNNHTDPGQYWDWAFYLQLIKQDSTAPHITSLPPAARVQVFDPVAITFDERMEKASTQASFHLSPAAAGSFSWSSNFRTMYFTPSSPLQFDTTYTVTIDSGAHNYLGTGLDVNADGHGGGETYTMQFQTVKNDTVPPVLTSTYPVNNQTGLSNSLMFEMNVSEQLMPATVTTAVVTLRDSLGTTIPVTGIGTTTVGSGVRVTLRPASDLAPNAPYTLTINPVMEDYGGNTIAAPVFVNFRTGVPQSFVGTVLNTLDAVGSWWQPGTSGSTVGYTSCGFAIATDVKKFGTGSGKVTYLFSGSSGGAIREHNSSTPSVEPGPLVSAWVFGDNSGNALDFWFYYTPVGASQTYMSVPAATLDWTGWKLVSVSIAGVPPATRKFTSFVIRQVPGARLSGTVYFDNLAQGTAVTGVAPASLAVPSAFHLDQNYPNPFNPVTTIQYHLAASGPVRIQVYDALGRQVETLLDASQPAGTYRVTWDAARQPSGVYFVRMAAGSIVETKKMVVLK